MCISGSHARDAFPIRMWGLKIGISDMLVPYAYPICIRSMHSTFHADVEFGSPVDPTNKNKGILCQ